MNKFYTESFLIACRECHISPVTIPNRDAIILRAISKLTPKEQDFIGMIKPMYLENDPNGKFSMSNVRKTCKAFHMTKNQLRKYKREIRHKIITNIKRILQKIF